MRIAIKTGVYPQALCAAERLIWNRSRLKYLDSVKKPSDESAVERNTTLRRIELLEVIVAGESTRAA